MNNNLSDTLVSDLKKYILLTEKINHLQEQINDLKFERQSIETNLIPEMLKNNLDKKKIQYNDKKISIRNEKIYTNLSFKYLNEKLNKYLKNTKLVEEIIQYLKSERNVKTNKIIHF